MNEQSVSIPAAAGTASGFFYSPAETGHWPGIIHLTDIFGMRPASRQMAERLAALGYCVLQPNIFYRTGEPPFFDSPVNFADERIKSRFRELSAPLTPEAMQSDAAAYAAFLAAEPSVKKGGLGVVGYCFTGAMALRAAAALPERIAAAASFHGGGLVTDAPTSPHTLLPLIRARLFFGHAFEDRAMPQEAIEKLDRALQSWGGTFESETYAGARHGWTVPDSAVYNEPQAERAFAKLSALFGAALK